MEQEKTEVKLLPGRGLDVGTGLLVVAQMDSEGSVHTKSVRDSFLEIKPSNKVVYGITKKGLIKAGINFFEDDHALHILGNDSLVQSVEKNLVISRPMKKGVISPTEAKALPMFKALLKELLGEPLIENEKIIYSIPASPTDAPFDITYHESVIEAILESLGYKATSINEAQAIVFSELGEEGDDYTGLGVSCGSGMHNISISSLAEAVATFAVSRGGDYIDFSTAASLGYDPKDPKACEITPNLITYIKEQGVDIRKVDHQDKIKGAIVAHYRNLIKYVISNLISEINKLESKPRFLRPVKLVVSGGTSLAIGYLEVFKKELDSVKHQLPFEISEVVHANDPLVAVAQGALLTLLAEES